MKDLGKKDCRYQCDLIWLSMTMQRKKETVFIKIFLELCRKTQVVRPAKKYH